MAVNALQNNEAKVIIPLSEYNSLVSLREKLEAVQKNRPPIIFVSRVKQDGMIFKIYDRGNKKDALCALGNEIEVLREEISKLIVENTQLRSQITSRSVHPAPTDPVKPKKWYQLW